MRFVGSRMRRRWGSSWAGTDSALLWRMYFHHLSSLEIHPGQEGFPSPTQQNFNSGTGKN
jgi:hypothetical protein